MTATTRAGRLRAPALIGLVVVLIGFLIAALTPRGQGDDHLDPRSARPDGARAVVAVLRQAGVDVQLVTDSRVAAGRARGATVLVNRMSVLTGSQLDRLAAAGAARLVLVTPEQDALDRLAPGVVLKRVTDPGARRPACALPDAEAAGRAAAGSALYGFAATPAGRDQAGRGALCYPQRAGDDAGAYLLAHSTAGIEVVLLGRPALLSNGTIAEDGNAALALRTLGRTPRLVWYDADPLEPAPADRRTGLVGLLPAWLPWVGAVLGLSVLAVMLWRGRRLGPLVGEPLPVVVRAAETQEGRARLYRQARARDRAADRLRAASLRRLARRLRGGARGSGQEVVGAVAAASGRGEADVARVLLGAPPRTDLELVKLADELDRLEQDVARARGTTA